MMGMNVQETVSSPLVWHPQTAAEAWILKRNFGIESVYTSGGTLLRTHWESGVAAMPKHLIDVGAIRGLNECSIGEQGLLIGSQMSLQACRTNAFLQCHFPMVTEAIRTIAAPSIRQIATIGGNVASYIGDSIPALLVYDADVHWYNGTEELQTPLMEWLLHANDSSRENKRLLLSLHLPFKKTEDDTIHVIDEEMDSNAKMKRFGAYHKVGRREAFTPSVVTAAVNGSLTNSGVLKEIRIALGGGQTIPQRLGLLEKEINEAAVDARLLQHVYNRILQLYEPREDIFAPAAYRKTTAANLIVTELWKAAKV